MKGMHYSWYRDSRCHFGACKVDKSYFQVALTQDFLHFFVLCLKVLIADGISKLNFKAHQGPSRTYLSFHLKKNPSTFLDDPWDVVSPTFQVLGVTLESYEELEIEEKTGS